MKDNQNAIIVEIRGRYAAAMTEDGAFVRVRNASFSPGQAVALSPRAQNAGKRARHTALASMAAGFLLLVFGGFMGYVTPAGVVSLDVNPSIEYTINCLDRVLEIEAVNDDGGQVLQGMDARALLYRPVDDAVEATIEQLRESGYLAEETENDVVLSASSYNEEHAGRLMQRLSARVEQQKDLTVYAVTVTKGDVSSAHALETSAGKYYLIERLGESIGETEPFDPQDWVDKSVREIIKETNVQPDTDSARGEQKTAAPKKTPAPKDGTQHDGGMQQNPPSGGKNGGSEPNGSGGMQAPDGESQTGGKP